MNHIDKNWKEFAGKCLPNDMTEGAADRSRALFYAGAISALAEISQARKVSDDYLVIVLREFAEEAETYRLEMLAGFLRKRKEARS